MTTSEAADRISEIREAKLDQLSQREDDAFADILRALDESAAAALDDLHRFWTSFSFANHEGIEAILKETVDA
jgi:hypothetical protein